MSHRIPGFVPEARVANQILVAKNQMVDVVDKASRSRMMAGIRGKNTKPEMLVRKGLHRLGFRYCLHYTKLPGKPDIVLPKYKAIILVNGCFWHAHDCHLFKWPTTRQDFWKEKILSNKDRDRRNIASYKDSNWKVLIIWECALKGKTRLQLGSMIELIASWIMFEPCSSENIGGQTKLKPLDSSISPSL